MFTDHYGRVLTPGAAPTPPAQGKLDVVGEELGLPEPRWRHPSGERLDSWSISFKDPPTAA